jgi:signal transduction histidine kinase
MIEVPTAVPQRATWLGLPRRVALGFALALVSVGLAAAFSFAALRARSEANRLAAHTAACRLAAKEVDAALLGSDAALDAYLREPDPRRLLRYRHAAAGLAPALASLLEVAEEDPAERALVARLQPEVLRVAAAQARALARAAAGDAAGARGAYDGRVHSVGIERTRAMLEKLEHLERYEAMNREALRARVVAGSNAVFVGAEVVLLFLVVLAARIVRTEIRRRERAMEIQRRLVGIVSHDLRNPLFAILTSTWALQRAGLGADGLRAVQRIGTSARRMHRLIRDLLDWGRAHAGADIPVARRDTDVAALCARVAEDLDPFGGRRIDLAAAGDTHAAVDPDRTEQVVANLLTNALRYAPPGRPVRVRVAGAGEDVRIEVSDDGPGIAPELTAELFEPFRRAAEEPHGDTGVGLGLFIVRTLAEAQGGRVLVDTRPGVGTTFTVHLPRGAGEIQKRAAHA